MTIDHFVQSARSAFVHTFVRYGSGADHLRAITQTKWWNTASWVLIVVGIVGWAAFIFWPY
jgi:uncharacterized membrane protein